MLDERDVKITLLRPSPVIFFDPNQDDGLPCWNYQIVHVLHNSLPQMQNIAKAEMLFAAAGRQICSGDVVHITSSRTMCAYEYHCGAWEELLHFMPACEKEEAV